MLILTGRLDQLARTVADLGLGVTLHIEATPSEINWRLTGSSPLETSPVNASGTQKSEDLAIRDIIAAAHEQLWEGVTLEAPTPDDAVPLPPLDEKLADWVDVKAEADLTTDDLLAAYKASPDEAEQVVRKLTRARRKRFTELLNVELAELQQERGGPGENLKREGEIESLLGLFARVGEM